MERKPHCKEKEAIREILIHSSELRRWQLWIVMLRKLSFIPGKLLRYYSMNTHMRTVTTGPRVVQQTYGPPDDSRTDPPDSCIDRVPRSIRAGKKEAYTPKILSIGPLHRRGEELQDMDGRKERHEEGFFRRTERNREYFSEIINTHSNQIQNFYSGTSNLENDEHFDMIRRDAIFILELLLRNFEGNANDRLLRIPADKLALKLDLLLLENQLPYFLLEEIYNSIRSSLSNLGNPSFIKICLKFFRPLFFSSDVSDEHGFMHFTDMLRDTLVQNFRAEDRPEDYEGNDSEPLPCATKLHESGVKFTRDQSPSLLEVKFEGSELRMPLLSVHHKTETLLRNIMALEQCKYHSRTIVCDYVILLDDLIEDERDTQLLVDAGIISNSIGDCKALANLFNKLSVEICSSGYHYNYIYQGLKGHYNSKYNRDMAKLKSVYFGDIWKGTATIGASVLLILTFLQTINSFKR
ncbi:UPF0481 protein At3g47200-like [Mangifera indica]|uniref:UPF0481 protein At3g47200-like n=1 Tax=Mangifera indica TaxID=29780 RepID=UPI001CFC300F|nr:UPF0481 protein At3g47200-like [Mangifera indica]